jgi:hypothetical protein
LREFILSYLAWVSWRPLKKKQWFRWAQN